METIQIKRELHEYIDNISDEKELIEFYETTIKHPKTGSRKGKINEIDPKANHQQEELNEALRNGSIIENPKEKELNKSISRWFNDGGGNPV